MNSFYLEEFVALATPIIEKENFQKQKDFMQHGKTSVYTHVVNVAYESFLYAKEHEGYDIESLIRGALLHDYFLYDWHKPHGILHGPLLPRRVMKNAIRDYEINKKEQNIILAHMFPLNFVFPRSKEAWLVAKMDRKCYKDETKRRKKACIKNFNIFKRKKLAY